MGSGDSNHVITYNSNPVHLLPLSFAKLDSLLPVRMANYCCFKRVSSAKDIDILEI